MTAALRQCPLMPAQQTHAGQMAMAESGRRRSYAVALNVRAARQSRQEAFGLGSDNGRQRITHGEVLGRTRARLLM